MHMSQAIAQALAVVLHLLNQKLYLAAQGFTLEEYYGPEHPTCQGTLARLPSTGSRSQVAIPLLLFPYAMPVSRANVTSVMCNTGAGPEQVVC